MIRNIESKGPGGPAPMPGPEDNPPVSGPGESGGPGGMVMGAIAMLAEAQ